MPELPEVEFARSCLERWLKGRTLARVEAGPSRILRGSSPAALEALAGRKVLGVDRRGKWLLVRLDRGMALGGHLGMTGRFELHPPGAPVRWSRARLHRADRHVVHFIDPRLFGRLRPGTREEVEREEGYRLLGPDAWTAPFSADELHALLQGRRRAIKDALMDQTLLAGVGNIQATEALFHARVHPARPAQSLSREEIARVLEGVRWTLERTLAMNEGDTITYLEESGVEDNPFVIYGRAGEPCPECGRTLEKMEIGGRTSAYCPACQRRPRGAGRGS